MKDLKKLMRSPCCIQCANLNEDIIDGERVFECDVLTSVVFRDGERGYLPVYLVEEVYCDRYEYMDGDGHKEQWRDGVLGYD